MARRKPAVFESMNQANLNLTKLNQMLADTTASIKYHKAMTTTIRCEQIEDDLILINGKEVREDMNGNWIGKSLDLQEAKFFNIFLSTIKRINTSKHISAEYRL